MLGSRGDLVSFYSGLPPTSPYNVTATGCFTWTTLGWSKLQEVQKSPLPGHFPIHFDILVWKMQKNLKKIVVLPLLKSNLCLLLPLCSNQLTNTLL